VKKVDSQRSQNDKTILFVQRKGKIFVLPHKNDYFEKLHLEIKVSCNVSIDHNTKEKFNNLLLTEVSVIDQDFQNSITFYTLFLNVKFSLIKRWAGPLKF